MSGWNFLNKAETFLDRVLDDQKENKEGGPAAVQSPGNTIHVIAPASPAAGKGESAGGRLSLQERLARAAASSKTGSPVPIATPVAQQPALVAAAEIVVPAKQEEVALTENQQSPIFPTNRPDTVDAAPQTAAMHAEPRTSLQSTRDAPLSVRASLESTRPSTDLGTSSLSMAELQANEARRVQEVTQAAERISALEAKLRYYTAEELQTSRSVLSAGDTSAMQRKLAEREEKIALLVQEGDLLAKREGQHQETIRKLRARMQELEKLIAVSLKAVEKAEGDVAKWKQEHKTIGEVSKRQADKIRQLSALETEADALRKLKTAHVSQIGELKRQLADEHALNVANASLAQQLQAEKSKTDALQKRVGVLLTEAKEQADEQDAELAALQAKYDRLDERIKQVESERKSEVFRLESQVESLLAQVEESSAGVAEHAQTKLLRQMENLQTQHSIAVQNWSRIEESLLARVAAAEGERDRLEEAEAALKTRLREQASRMKQIEEDASTVQGQLKRAGAAQEEWKERTMQLQAKLDDVVQTLETERSRSRKAQVDVEAQIETRVQERLESERSAYESSMAAYLPPQSNGQRSPELTMRGFTESPGSLQLRTATRPGLGSARRSSSQVLTPVPKRRMSQNQLGDMDGMRSPPSQQDEHGPLHSESTTTLLTLSEAPASRALSIATSTAGPGLGMMERISANARKLEMDLSMCREDLARMTQQRDEARQACVDLDAAATERGALQEALQRVGTEHAALTTKFEATLELLGEQTEENEQLREDIADMKQAYRDTLEKQFGQ
ncbi:TATA element modulatory factor 1 TATA binding-domain-containing protein [Protomyces lactucae-debilis]|uniref:TATA element modulatory factor 1 TATA binding-domain-containing protein n=1 Tax=Protomyces lactucae-debilis TaxID=2754530 RepID=A0A1Y2EX95_PROLT|nr:TATA element modulatory factor 1 TATA binding-domain-containing protein [Protomyces lactucae-debilis]ORY75435.1 TATA element modulatory factor 1 TATA binding-domain-containing protein [Protomyces lactucae-debilis]